MINPHDDPDITMVPASNCFACGHTISAIGPTGNSLKGIRPSPGDPILCLQCGALQTIRPDGTLRKMEDFEFRQLPAGQQAFVKTERRQLLAFNARHRGRFN